MKRVFLILLAISFPLMAEVDLLALYNFTDADYLDVDLSGNFNNLTFSGSPVYGNGVLNFDGIDDYAATSINPAGSFSISFWFKPQKQGAAQYIIRSSSSSQGYAIWYNVSNRISAHVYGGDFGNILSPIGATPADGSWYHIALTFEATGDAVNGIYPGVSKLYLNGTLVGQDNADNYKPVPGAATNIGASHVLAEKLQGSIKELAIYSGTLQSGDVAMLASGERNPISLFSQDTISVSKPPFSYYPFNNPDNLVQAAVDFGSNGSNLTFYGDPVSSGGYMSFDGVNDYATTNIDPEGSFSVSFWFKPQKQGVGQFIVFSSPSNHSGYTIFYSTANDIRAIVYDSVNLATKFVRSKALPAGDSFHHIVLTFEATGDAVDGAYPGTTRLYVDGVLDSTVLDDAYKPQNAQPTYIGALRGTSGFYGGLLDDFAVWKYTLKDWQIEALAAKEFTAMDLPGAQILVSSFVVTESQRIGQSLFRYSVRPKVINIGDSIDNSELILCRLPDNVDWLSETNRFSTGILGNFGEKICEQTFTMDIDRSAITDVSRIYWRVDIENGIGVQSIQMTPLDISITEFGDDGLGFSELLEIARSWLSSGIADRNNDGIVNYEDFAILSNN